MKLERSAPLSIPLRLRLTIWYTFVVGLIFFLLAVFLYFQVRRSLIAQVDAALDLAVDQALIGVGEVDGRLAFVSLTQNPDAVRNLTDDFVISLLAQDGAVWDILSSDNEIPRFESQTAGQQTQLDRGGEAWRINRQEIEIGGVRGWVQAAQELDPVIDTLVDLQRQLIWGLPIALLLAGFGGYWLAARALQPIDRITRTARAISGSDLTQRIAYHGPADEVGRLAQTFDTMLDRLQAAFARERQFTANAAHELRTPLAALKGRIGVTLSQPRQTEEYTNTLQEMEEQVDRLIRLSSDLLFMARLEQETLRRQKEAIDAHDFLGAVVDQIRPLAAAKTIGITETIPAGLAIVGDMDLLIRLFLNLLDNAVKYTPAGGEISISSHEDAQQIAISITDTGLGIPDTHLPHLFERFYRVEKDRARHLEGNDLSGAGLGLAIAVEIARSHGGQISVKSQVNKGTTFIVYLPRPKKD